MTQSHAIDQVNDDQESSLSVQWSEQFFRTGQSNEGSLSVAATPAIQLKKGDWIELTITEPDWIITSDDRDTWKVKKKSTSLKSLFYLEYQKDARTMPQIAMYLLGGHQKSDAPLDIGLNITPPADANANFLKTQIFDAAGPLSRPSNLLLNYIEPDVPIAAFAENPAVVLLSKSGSTDFPNTIHCGLLNQSTANITAGSLVLNINAYDDQNQAIAIDQALKVVQVASEENGPVWEPHLDAATPYWSTSLDGEHPIAHGDTLSVSIAELVLRDQQIAMVTAEFSVTDVPGSQGYATSGRFQAYGPYSISLTPNTSETNHKFYFYAAGQTPGEYLITACNPSVNQPPLRAYLTFGENNEVVYPPIAGAFSWDKSNPDMILNHSLTPGNNEFYYLVAESENEFRPLASADVGFNTYPESISSKSFDQHYKNSVTQEEGFASIMPPGAIILWNGSAGRLPAGWVLCDGTKYTTAGGETLTAPNLQDKFVMGAGKKTNAGITGGSETFTIDKVDQLPAHDHLKNTDEKATFQAVSTQFQSKERPVVYAHASWGWAYFVTADIPEGSKTPPVNATIESQGNGDPIEHMPPYYTLCYIMKI